MDWLKMEFKLYITPYIIDRVLHWLTVLMLLLMLNLSTQLHYTNWQIKGPVLHRQEAVEFHASVGLIILFITLIRAFYIKAKGANIPRLPAKSKRHRTFIKGIHIGMYSSLLAIVFTGLGLINNYEIPLSVYGVDIVPVKQDFLDVFPSLLEVHLALQNVFWSLVAIHFIGFVLSKR